MRFVQVTGAVLRVGGQPALTPVVLRLARRMLSAEARDRFAAAAGRRFGPLTGTVILPVQLGTGRVMARHEGVTWASLAEPGHGAPWPPYSGCSCW
ncbi:hypothetical protein ACIF83_06960 [Streptomyces sp. NPDC085866]|uniref:hypothetical protein n=1 Tax=unclassified Streptomyces TaxID=2593676 RepID=UPI0037D29577